MNKEIWVVCDHVPDGKADIIFGMLTKAFDLAKKADCHTTAVCFGKHSSEYMQELFYYGTENVLHIEHDNVSTEIQSKILCQVISQRKPVLIMFPASEYGRRMASYVSDEFEAGLTAECIEIEFGENKNFEYKRAAINSSAIVTIQCINSDVELCTVKENIFIPKRLNEPLDGKIEKNIYDETFSDIFSDAITVLEKEEKITEKLDINSSKIVFGAGRGIKDAETVELLFSVANKIGASVVGTRAIVEENLIERFRQVGQSGISIRPEIYICFGVSGASQHIVGIKNAKIIVAVNTDENAPIFDYADYIIHDDAVKVLKEIEEYFNKKGEIRC